MSDLRALFPGTFDPVTFGHLDLIRRGAGLFDTMIVAVVRGGPGGHFGLEKRMALIREAVREHENVSVEPFAGLLVDLARRLGARVLLRGVRGVRDFEYELEMAWANRGLAPGIETVFLAPSPRTALVSSSLVREVASLGGDVSLWVPPHVSAALRAAPPSLLGGGGLRKEE